MVRTLIRNVYITETNTTTMIMTMETAAMTTPMILMTTIKSITMTVTTMGMTTAATNNDPDGSDKMESVQPLLELHSLLSSLSITWLIET